MKALSVSGAQDYQQLCIAAYNEEHHLTELVKQQQCATRDPVSDSTTNINSYTRNLKRIGLGAVLLAPSQLHLKMMIFCHANIMYVCGKTGHITRTCSLHKGKSVPKIKKKFKDKDSSSAIKAIKSVEKNLISSPLDIPFRFR